MPNNRLPPTKTHLFPFLRACICAISDGQYEETDDEVYGIKRPVPSDPIELDGRVDGEPLRIGVVSATATSAVIRVVYRNETKNVEIRMKASLDDPTPFADVFYAAESVKVLNVV